MSRTAAGAVTAAEVTVGVAAEVITRVEEVIKAVVDIMVVGIKAVVSIKAVADIMVVVGIMVADITVMGVTMEDMAGTVGTATTGMALIIMAGGGGVQPVYF